MIQNLYSCYVQSLQNKVSPYFLKYKFSRIYQERNEVSQSMKWQKTNLLRKKKGTKPDNSKWPAFKCETRRISLRARWGIPMVRRRRVSRNAGIRFSRGIAGSWIIHDRRGEGVTKARGESDFQRIRRTKILTRVRRVPIETIFFFFFFFERETGAFENFVYLHGDPIIINYFEIVIQLKFDQE